MSDVVVHELMYPGTTYPFLTQSDVDVRTEGGQVGSVRPHRQRSVSVAILVHLDQSCEAYNLRHIIYLISTTYVRLTTYVTPTTHVLSSLSYLQPTTDINPTSNLQPIR